MLRIIRDRLSLLDTVLAMRLGMRSDVQLDEDRLTFEDTTIVASSERNYHVHHEILLDCLLDTSNITPIDAIQLADDCYYIGVKIVVRRFNIEHYMENQLYESWKRIKIHGLDVLVQEMFSGSVYYWFLIDRNRYMMSRYGKYWQMECLDNRIHIVQSDNTVQEHDDVTDEMRRVFNIIRRYDSSE